jgi:ferredoxin
MARPDFVICLECESEVEDFVWRDGELRRASCEVCGNTDPDAFSLPEDHEQDLDEADEEGDGEEEEEEEEEDEEELLDDYDDFDEEDEE